MKLIKSVNYFRLENSECKSEIDFIAPGEKIVNWPKFIAVCNIGGKESIQIDVLNSHENEQPIKDFWFVCVSNFGFWRIKYKNGQL